MALGGHTTGLEVFEAARVEGAGTVAASAVAEGTGGAAVVLDGGK
jgi:hypothetical protein